MCPAALSRAWDDELSVKVSLVTAARATECHGSRWRRGAAQLGVVARKGLRCRWDSVLGQAGRGCRGLSVGTQHTEVPFPRWEAGGRYSGSHGEFLAGPRPMALP